LTLGESSPNESISGSTLFYNPSGSNSGSFSVDATTADSESGLDKVTFPALTGMTGGGDVGALGPYGATYAWTNASTTEPGASTVTARNNSGLTSSAQFTVTKDTAAPTSQTLALVGGPWHSGSSVA